MSPATATTKGKLTGIVTDDAGAVLPGVTVTISSPSLIGGERIEVTDTAGRFSFVSLAPGTYTATLELDSFVSQERQAIEVHAGRTVELFVEMGQATVTETVMVVADTPVIDTEQISIADTFTAEYLVNATVGSTNRSYQNVLGQSAGVTTSGGNPIVFGSTTDENQFNLDGFDTTDVVTATFGYNLLYDIIDEINFETGGFEAQYGRATGGVVNVVTKSGGNEFSGSLDYRYRSNSFFRDGEHFDRDLNPSKRTVSELTLGGPLQRDRLWFFVAGGQTDSQTTPSESPTTFQFDGLQYFGKLTWQSSPSWSLVGTAFGDPTDIDNANASRSRTVDATRFQEQGGSTVGANLTGLLTSALILESKVATTRNELNSMPQSGDATTPGHQVAFGAGPDVGLFHTNYTNTQLSDRDRDQARASLSWYTEGRGSHEFKIGIEYDDLSFRSENFTTSGFRYQDSALAEGGWVPFVLWDEPNSGPDQNDGEVIGAFVQDNWQLLPNLSLKLGVRYDEASFSNGQAGDTPTLDKLQPRAGLAWDLSNDGKTVARLSVGRFMHPNATTLPSFIRSNNLPSAAYLSCSTFGFDMASCQAAFGGNTVVSGGVTFEGWIPDPSPDGLGNEPNGWLLVPANVFGSGAPNTIDSGLESMFADQLIVGIEREIGPRTSIELSFVDKSTEDIFEDTCTENLPTRTEGGACEFYTIANLSELSREYEGWLLRFESRATDWMHLRASYAYSKSEGSVEDTQNSGADFDFFPVHFENRFGYLSDDRRHRLKLNGFFLLPLGFSAGVDAFWSDDFAYNSLENVLPYSVRFDEPRGSRRANSNYQVDLELRKQFRLADRVDVSVIGSIFNLLDDERPVNICENINGCSGGLVLGDATDFQDPQRFELGFRLVF